MALRPFAAIRAQAAARKGGEAALAALLPTMKAAAELAAIPDDRWLSMMSRCVFQAGFSWQVVEKKWPGTEAAFWDFSPARCRAMSDEEFDGLLKDGRIIRNGAKVAVSAEQRRFRHGPRRRIRLGRQGGRRLAGGRLHRPPGPAQEARRSARCVVRDAILKDRSSP
jgi:hypothetical protein